jgi:hypothetical protein
MSVKLGHTESETQAKGVHKQAAQEDVWTYKRPGKSKVEKTAYCGALRSVRLSKYFSHT